ncbi:MAG: hypothetical protein HYT80_01755 [Euryarchaeota archaeon]|nr:hypothetical protein [Euryarchaeota archaeon]
MYLRKAREFARLMDDSAARGDWNALGLAAVHVGISSMDAVTTWFLKERSSDADHGAAAHLVRRVPLPDARDRAEQFEKLVRMKDTVEYEARFFGSREARASRDRAQRLLAWAEESIGRPPRP